MNSNQQFAVSCHILAILAAYPDLAVTSETIAESVDTNPVVIRRIMSRLRQYGLVNSRPGTNGGWRLGRASEELNLREAYRAISYETLLAVHQHPNIDCPIGGNIQSTLESLFGDAQTALETVLEKVSVANLLDNTLRGTFQTLNDNRDNDD